MRSLKSHISLTVALFAILFTVQVFIVVLRMIDSYEERLRSSYAMILTSHAVIEQKQLQEMLPQIQSLTTLSNEDILEELSQDLDKKQITLLKATLPYFYELKLDHFPQPEEIARIKQKLLTIEGIAEVESFANRHDQVYRLLLLIKSVVKLFSVIVIIISMLVILKEMRLWQFNHQDRMQIMALFGSPVWLRSAVLFRYAVLDAIFATIIITLLFVFIKDAPIVTSLFDAVGIHTVLLKPFPESFILLLIALVTSLSLAMTLVLRKV